MCAGIFLLELRAEPGYGKGYIAILEEQLGFEKVLGEKLDPRGKDVKDEKDEKA